MSLPDDVWLQIILEVVETSPPVSSQMSPVIDTDGIASGYLLPWHRLKPQPRRIKHRLKAMALTCLSWNDLIRSTSKCHVLSIGIKLENLPEVQSLLDGSLGCDVVATLDAAENADETLLVRSATDVLRKHASQWLALKLNLPPDHLWHSALSGLHFPRLRSLEIEVLDNGHVEVLIGHEEPISTPALQFLSLSGVPTPIRFTNGCSNLQMLKLDFHQDYYANILETLASLPSVRHLDIHGRGRVFWEFGMSNIPDVHDLLPRLERLWMRWSFAIWPNSFCKSLAGRELRLVSTQIYQQDNSADAIELAPTVAPTAETVQWDGCVASLPFNLTKTKELLIRFEGRSANYRRTLNRKLSLLSLRYLSLEGIQPELGIFRYIEAPRLATLRLGLTDDPSWEGLHAEGSLDFPLLEELVVTVSRAESISLLRFFAAPSLRLFEVISYIPIGLLWIKHIRNNVRFKSATEIRLPYDPQLLNTISTTFPGVETLRICYIGRQISYPQSRLDLRDKTSSSKIDHLKRLEIAHRWPPICPENVQQEIWAKNRFATAILELEKEQRKQGSPLQLIVITPGVLNDEERQQIRATGVELSEEDLKESQPDPRWVSFI
jgi:hypothetical protein